MKNTPPAAPGRPRDADLDARTKAAVWGLLAEKPLANLTINEIATAAGTTRPAIYRRWGSVEEIALDAFLEQIKIQSPTEITDNPGQQLHEYIRALAALVEGNMGKIIVEILGRIRGMPDLMARFHEGFTEPRRGHARKIIERGQEMGIFRTDLNIELMVDLYAGPVYFRAFSRHAYLDETFGKQLADSVTDAIRLDRQTT